MSTLEPAARPRIAARSGRASRPEVRKALFNLHLWVGLALSVWFVLLGLTGSLLVFKPQADALLNPQLMRSQSAGQAAMITPDAALAAAQTAYPDTAFKRLAPPLGKDGVYELRYGKEKAEREVFVDAYTGAVRGERDREGTLMKQVLEVHKSLLLGEGGKQANGIGALLLVGLLATGLYLWWPANAKQWPQRLTVKTQASKKRLLFDLHNVFGIYTLPVLLVIAVTGAVFIYEKQVERGVYALTATPMPPEKEKEASHGPKGHGKQDPKHGAREAKVPQLAGALAGLIRVSEATAPGTHLKHVDLPDKEGKPVRVHRERRSGLWINNKVRVQLDPHTAGVIRVEDEQKDPLPRRILRWNGPLHEGRWGGPWSQWLYLVIAAVTPLALVVTGTLKWAQTRQSRAKNRGRERVPARRAGARPASLAHTREAVTESAPAG